METLERRLGELRSKPKKSDFGSLGEGLVSTNNLIPLSIHIICWYLPPRLNGPLGLGLISSLILCSSVTIILIFTLHFLPTETQVLPASPGTCSKSLILKFGKHI